MFQTVKLAKLRLSPINVRSLRNVEDLLHERGIDISYETVRYWWNRFGPLFASGRCQSKFTAW